MSQPRKTLCPICGAALKTNEQLAGGAKVQCPKCKTIFNIPQDAVASASPPPAAPAASSGQLSDASTATIPASQVDQIKPASPLANGTPSIVAAPKSKSSRGMFVFAGFATLFVVGAGLAIFCFSGGLGDAGDKDQGPPKVRVKKHKSSAKKAVPLIQLTKDEEKQVKAMTDKAIAFLKKTQGKDGSWQVRGISRHHAKQAVADFTAMGGLTLLECGEPANGPHVRKAAQYVRRVAPKLTSTYGLSLALLFLGRLHGESKEKTRIKGGADDDLALINKLAMRLTAGQKTWHGGGWSYKCPVLAGAAGKKLFAVLKRMGKRSAAAFVGSRINPIKGLPNDLQKLPIFKPWDDAPLKTKIAYFRKGGDNSNTQFAILGLLAAQKVGAPVHQPLRLAAARFRHTQQRDGSWGYNSGNPPRAYPSMTCAGLLGLAVEYFVEEASTKKKSPKDDPAIQRALKLVSQKIGGRGVSFPEMYFMWSVERVAVLFRLKEIAGKDWYRWGMHMLQRRQAGDGSWTGANTPGGTSKHADTCFGLLFLQRTNLAADLTDKLEELERLNRVAMNHSKKE